MFNMKDRYKKTQISIIPDDWDIRTIKSLGEIVSGGTPSTTNSEYWDGNSAWCTPTDITSLNTCYIKQTNRNISELGLSNSSAKQLPVNSLVVCTRATIGDCAINLVPMSTNQGFKSIIFNGKNDYKFAYYIVCSIKETMKMLSSGSTFLEISKKAFESIKIPLPPLPEQKKIAEILTSVDNTIESTRKVIEQTKKVKQGLLQELLTKGIGHTTFKKTEIGEIPEEWEVRYLNELIDKKSSITYGIVQTGSPIVNGVKCIRVVDIVKKEIQQELLITTTEEISQSYQKTVLRKNDIMFALRGAIGHVRMVDKSLIGCNLTRGIALIRHNDLVDPRFLICVIQSPAVKREINDKVNGSALKEIPLKELRNVKIPLPNKIQQTKIAEIIDSVSNEIKNTEKELTQLQHLKKGLMQDLLTGKVRVKV